VLNVRFLRFKDVKIWFSPGNLYHLIYKIYDLVTEMSFKDEALDKIGALMTAAFGLVAALAWNGAILEIFKQVFGEASTIVAQLAYAIIVTIIAIIFTIWIARAISHAKGEEKKEKTS
jgi:hypothetical protein